MPATCCWPVGGRARGEAAQPGGQGDHGCAQRRRLELNAIGNNLNQIARHLNTTGELRDWGELREALALFEKGEARHIAAVTRVLDL